MGPVSLGDLLQFGFAVAVATYLLTVGMSVLRELGRIQRETSESLVAAMGNLTDAVQSFKVETRATLAEIRRARNGADT